MTDHRNWHLEVKEGRQVWKYIEDEAKRIQTVVDKYHLGLDTGILLFGTDTCVVNAKEIPPSPPATTPIEACRKGIAFYVATQTEDGHWADDYGGPMFLLPGLVITCYITGTELHWTQRAEIIQYLRNLQAKDGGWGLHIEGHSTMFGTALNYVAMRLLGVDKDDPAAVRARNFIKANGGAKGVPTWGKVWLSCLGVYEWEGVNPIPPELWLLPYSVPFHPGRWWCHCRVVYLPMGYLYGRKVRAKDTDLTRSLRELSFTPLSQELYVEPYSQINWNSCRNNVCPLDRYIPQSTFLWTMFEILTAYEKVHSAWVRKKALDLCLDHIKAEDVNTKWICIGPVNKAFNMLAVWFAEGNSEHFRRHQERVPDYLWLAPDGMKMQGYNGSQLWDTAFCVQAIVESGLAKEFAAPLRSAYNYIDITQVPEDVPQLKKYYRHISKGAWPFSTRDHGWPIADCTGEGLTAAFRILDTGNLQRSLVKPFDRERYEDAVNVILSLQNSDGGWATYENKRGPDWVEWFNPAEVFYGIMVDYSYVELTSSAMKGLAEFHKRYPNHRAQEIKTAIKRGLEFIKKKQRPDGSWYGSWGICFTYGTWFAIEALVDNGEPLNSPYITKAVKFLLSKQKEDGGWGESFLSCVKFEYVQHEMSQVVNTAWAVLALLKARCEDRQAIERGVRLIMSRQLPDGNWKQEAISGVFNANCMISYSGYKNFFSFWALGRYANMYPSARL